MARPPAKVGELGLRPVERLQISALTALPWKPLLDFVLEKMGSGKLAYTPNTGLFNQTGQPAMSVPLFWNDRGLPIGTQFAGAFGDEATLFRLASQLAAHVYGLFAGAKAEAFDPLGHANLSRKVTAPVHAGQVEALGAEGLEAVGHGASRWCSVRVDGPDLVAMA